MLMKNWQVRFWNEAIFAWEKMMLNAKTWFIYTIIIKSFILLSLASCLVSASESGKIAFAKVVDKNWEIVAIDENGGNKAGIYMGRTKEKGVITVVLREIVW